MNISYNIYYKYKKINKIMISKDEVDKLVKQKSIYKITDNGDMEKIPVQNLSIKKCTII